MKIAFYNIDMPSLFRPTPYEKKFILIAAAMAVISSGPAFADNPIFGDLKYDRAITPMSADYDFSNISDFDVAPSGEVYILQATSRTIFCLTDFGLLNCRMPLPKEVRGEAGSIALLPNDQILIGADGLYLLEYNGQFVRRIDSAEAPLYSSGKIILSPERAGGVAIYVSQGNRVAAIDMDGRIKRVYGAGDIQSLRGVAVDDAGFVYTLDQGSYKVRVYSPDGTLSRTFGRAGGKAGTFSLVNGIGVTKDGSVWVADVTKSIFHVFDAEGNFRHPVPVPTPMGAIIERNGEVFLGSNTIPGIAVFTKASGGSGRTH